MFSIYIIKINFILFCICLLLYYLLQYHSESVRVDSYHTTVTSNNSINLENKTS